MENDINVDFADYQTILSHQGKIEGRVGSSQVDRFIDNLDNDFKSSLKNAKGVLIEFKKNDEMPLTQISSLMEEFHSIIDENADVIFGVTSNNELETDIVEYKIIVSGILSNSSPNTNRLKNVILLSGRVASGKTEMLISYTTAYPHSTLFLSSESSREVLITRGLKKEVAYIDGSDNTLESVDLSSFTTICIDYLELFEKNIIKKFIEKTLNNDIRIVVATQMKRDGTINNIFGQI